jgi:hypothetical protein
MSLPAFVTPMQSIDLPLTKRGIQWEKCIAGATAKLGGGRGHELVNSILPEEDSLALNRDSAHSSQDRGSPCKRIASSILCQFSVTPPARLMKLH